MGKFLFGILICATCLLFARFYQVLKLVSRYMGNISQRAIDLTVKLNSKKGEEVFNKKLKIKF